MLGEESGDLWERYLISWRRAFILLSLWAALAVRAAWGSPCRCLAGCWGDAAVCVCIGQGWAMSWLYWEKPALGHWRVVNIGGFLVLIQAVVLILANSDLSFCIIVQWVQPHLTVTFSSQSQRWLEIIWGRNVCLSWAVALWQAFLWSSTLATMSKQLPQ